MRRSCTTSTRNSSQRTRDGTGRRCCCCRASLPVPCATAPGPECALRVRPYSGASIRRPSRTRRHLRRGLHDLVPVEDLLGDGLGAVQSRNRREEIVRAEVLALDHSSAAEDITILGRAGAVEAAAQPVELLQNHDIPAWSVGIPDEERGCRQRCDASSDQIELSSRFAGLCDRYPLVPLDRAVQSANAAPAGVRLWAFQYVSSIAG